MDTEPSSDIVLRTQLDELTRLEQWTSALAAQHDLAPSLAYRIDLCLTELVTNALDYAYPKGTGGIVTLRFWCQPEQIVIRIDDAGVPFDPTSYVPAELPKSLAEATIGGRGILLVRHYANEIRYRRNAGANQLTLVFQRALPGQAIRTTDTCARA